MNRLLGPYTRTRRSAIEGNAYSTYAARCRATIVFPVPGPPSTTMIPRWGDLTTSSCSVWRVAAASRIRPVRAPLSAETRGPSPTTSSTVGAVPSRISSLTSTTSRSLKRRWRRRCSPSGETIVAE